MTNAYKTEEVKVNFADSLIQIGTSQLNEGKANSKQLKTEEKSLNKQYSTDRKPIEKTANSKDREEAKDAKVKLKEIHT